MLRVAHRDPSEAGILFDMSDVHLHHNALKKHRTRSSYSVQRYDKQLVVWCAALHIYLSLFWEVTSLPPQEKKQTNYSIGIL